MPYADLITAYMHVCWGGTAADSGVIDLRTEIIFHGIYNDCLFSVFLSSACTMHFFHHFRSLISPAGNINLR